MDSGAQRLQQLLAAVGETSRFQIVLELARRERHVSDLAKAIGLSQSCTTRHLQALERSGAVRTRRAGKRVVAALALQSPDVARLMQWLDAGLEADAPLQPGRTGGTDARRKIPQDAPPRQVRRSRRPPRPGGEDRAHAGPGASDTPPSAHPEAPAPLRRRPPDLEDFLL
jgi:DNA-binding transcriptional ArsR family regulator